jgi:hypothetical protein
MTDQSRSEERQERVIALLEDCIRTELQVTDGMLGLNLGGEALEALVRAVASGVLHGFTVDWSPGWVKQPGQVHRWEESGEFFARCGVCLVDSPPSPDELAAVTWAQNHEESHRTLPAS